MKDREADLDCGRRVVASLIDIDAHPPIVRREIKSVGRLDAELRLLGFRLMKKEKDYGPVGGYQLFYVKGAVLVRVKTRGSRSRQPMGRGAPHLTICLMTGQSVDGELDTGKHQELGQFNYGGGLQGSAPPRTGVFDTKRSPSARGLQDTWADATHFAFVDLVIDDSDVEQKLVVG